MLVSLFAVPFLLYNRPPAAEGTNVSGYPVKIRQRDIKLLIDSTSYDAPNRRRIVRQVIFDEILSMINRADLFVYVDFFLWNPWQGKIPENFRGLSAELAGALIKKKQDNPDMPILVLTDPINRIYGHHEPYFFKEMADAGIIVVFTDLARLPDSNPLAAALAGFYGRMFGAGSVPGSLADRPVLPNPLVFKGRPISVRQLSRLFLFKANHRKVVVTGSAESGLELLVGSLNPADGSSAHSNMALHLKGRVARTALYSELKIFGWSSMGPDAVLSGGLSGVSRAVDRIRQVLERLDTGSGGLGTAFVEWQSESAIAERLTGMLDSAGSGDEIRVALFYLSDRKVVRALKKAVDRGASLRLILDPNKDAFGRKKPGIPNRPVAAELVKNATSTDVAVRWADTHGEQFHTKAISITNSASGKYLFMTGSANWTRRNLQNLNLEADIMVRNAPAINRKFNEYFDAAWKNSDGMRYTLPYEELQLEGFARLWKAALYRFQEWSGMSTF